MKTVPIHELKRDLSSLVDEAEAGARILVTRHNRPVATLVPPLFENVHVGSRFGAGSLAPLEDVGPVASIAATLAEDRADDR